MTAGTGDLTAVAARIEQLLDQLSVTVIPPEYQRVEEVVRLVTELYGAGLERVLAITERDAPELLPALAADELLAGLLVVHGLHPDGLRSRVERALESVRPILRHHDGDVELLDVDDAAGAVHLRLLGSCDGCPSSSVTLQHAVETAIRDAAPEVAVIDVEARATVVLPARTPGGPDGRINGRIHDGLHDGTVMPVALGRKPVYDECPSLDAVAAATGRG